MSDNLSEYKEKYETYRHHAWAGLGLLTVFVAINYLLSLPFEIALVVVSVLSIYIIVALIFTYWYSKGLGVAVKPGQPSAESERELAQSKAEKKRIKAELKAKKKAS